MLMAARWDAEHLLQPITPDRPCGEDVEYTLLPSFDGYRVFGQADRLDPTPDWAEIRDQAIAALSRSKDIRLLAYLGTALLRTDGLPAFTGTLAIAAEWLATYWAYVYPLIDEDAMQRRNALNCFADQMAVIDALRRVPLVSSRQHGTFSLRDVEIATGQIPPSEGDSRPDEAPINAAFAAMPLQALSGLRDSITAGVAAVKRIEATMAAEGGAEAIPALESLSAQLTRLDRLLRAQLASRPDAAAVTESSPDAESAATGAAAAPVGAIRSRQDAVRALDAVAEYFRKNEPSSPVPLFIERAKRLVSKNFLEVLADIAPDAVAQARSVGGVPEGE